MEFNTVKIQYEKKVVLLINQQYANRIMKKILMILI